MTKRLLIVALVCASLAACDHSSTDAQQTNSTVRDYAKDAQRIARESIIVDTHIDVPYRLDSKPADISKSTATGDFDWPRARSGGLNAPFMSIYTPAKAEAAGESRIIAERLIDMVEGFASRWPDKFAIARSPADVRDQFESQIMALPMGMENGSPIEGNLANLQHFYDRGIRYITPAHSLSNHIADSSYDKNRQWHGLSDFGVEVIKEMNRLGIMVDVSHVSDEAFWQIIDLTAAPAIASHSSARHFTPDFERNMSDEMIVALAKNGGVIQINFGSTFVTKKARDYADARSAAGKEWLAENPQFNEADINTVFKTIFATENGPLPFATLDDVLDHIDHVVELTSIDHVGIGSDYDGVGDSLPVGLKDVATYPNLIEGLLRRGYSEIDIQKLLGENLLRVWQQVEDHAGHAASTSSTT